jgi:multiple antibiotic resistance protein
MDWNLYLNFFAAMFAIINPIGIWPLWSEMTDDVQRKKVRRDIALLIIFSSLLILLAFFFPAGIC